MHVVLTGSNDLLLGNRIAGGEAKNFGNRLRDSQSTKRCRSSQPFSGDLGASNNEIVFDESTTREKILKSLFVMFPLRLFDIGKRIVWCCHFKLVFLLQPRCYLFQPSSRFA